MASSDLNKLGQQLKNASPTEIVQAALANGASPAQVAKLAESMGISKKEMAQVNNSKPCM